MLIHPETKARAVVPVHPGRTIKEPLLGAIVRDANLAIDELLWRQKSRLGHFFKSASQLRDR